MLTFLQDLWDETHAASFGGDPLETLRYRSNLLGADLRITNFGGGNTSSKYEAADPNTGEPVRVMAVKGSGGDLGSIRPTGFAVLNLDQLLGLERIYRGEAYEDEMADHYAGCAFAGNAVAPSIDTPLHAFLPFAHVDHLHPDWAIAMAASRNGKQRMEEFNARYGHHLVWLPWQRPGFELGLMLRQAVKDRPDCDGIVLASHGLFTWGDTQRQCYQHSLAVIDRMGEFIQEHAKGKTLFGGPRVPAHDDRRSLTVRILPKIRGRVSERRRAIAHFDDAPEVLEFAGSVHGPELAAMGSSCPDHFLRTRIAPLLVDWSPAEGEARFEAALDAGLAAYRTRYTTYYEANREPDSPALRDRNPTVVLVAGVGMISFGRSKAEARITGEFFRNAMRVMAGATLLAGESEPAGPLPHAKDPAEAEQFKSLYNYVALPPREAFRIEYWRLEEAKLQRMPPEKELSRQIVFVSGAGSEEGRAACLTLGGAGAHIMAADADLEAAAATAAECAAAFGKETAAYCRLNPHDSVSISAALEQTVLHFGGLDRIVGPAAELLTPQAQKVLEAQGLG